LLWTSLASAQLPTATILGTVRDASGAVVPGATLTAHSTETGQTRTAVSAADGSYRFAALPVGLYEVRISQPGFRSEVRSGLVLTVGQEAVVNFTLQVGATEQTVTVTAEAPLVNTTTGSLGGLVSEERVADLPLNGRNFVDLTLLQPGIQENKSRSPVASAIHGTFFSSNGAPMRSNNYLLDGAIMQDLAGANSSSASGASLGIEGIREWRVITNSFSAEYGMTMGSQMTIVTKSGTNSLHGSLFEYLRNDNLDARNFFDLKTAATPGRLPEFKRNSFGGSLGGPLRQDKAFFHAVYEGVRERLGRTLVSRTIPASARVDGGLVPQIDPRIKPLLTLYPEPNLPNNEFTFPFNQRDREDFGQARLDHTISSSDTWFGRYTAHDSEFHQPRDFPQFAVTNVSRNQYATLSGNHVFSPTLLNTFRFSYSRTALAFDSPSGIQGPQLSFVPGKDVGTIGVGGLTVLGPFDPTPVNLRQNLFTWSDDLFYTRGRHSLKFGTLINRYQQFLQVSTGNRGRIAFADLTAFLQARPTNFFAVTPGSILDRTYHYSTFGFYLQDDWRLMPTFTLNLGLRYEFLTAPKEVRGRGAALVDIQRDASTTLLESVIENPTLRNFSPRFGFAWDVRGDGRTAVRGGFGLLYDIGTLGSALIAGTTATPPFSNRSTLSGPAAVAQFAIPFVFPESAAGKAVRTLDYHVQQPYLMQYNLTVERELPLDMALTLAYGGSRGVNLLITTEGNPRVPQGIPQGGACVARPTGQPVSFTGPRCWLVGDARTNPAWDTIELRTASGNSNYNSLQVGLVKRLGRGLQFQSSYTWSKTMDETQVGLETESTTSAPFPADPSDRRLDRAPALFDTTQVWRLNTIYRLPELAPTGGLLDKLVNGWWLSGIVSVQSGLPFSPVLNSNRSRSGVNGGDPGIDRPDLLPGRTPDDIILGGPDRYFDPTAFAVPAAGFLGTASRNFLRGPGFATLDLSIAKDTPLRYLGENGRLQFRAEFFNILNRANFTTPGIGGRIAATNNGAVVFAGTRDGEPPLATAGRINSTASTSRQIQLALKVLF
jgi:hypothetical protein